MGLPKKDKVRSVVLSKQLAQMGTELHRPTRMTVHFRHFFSQNATSSKFLMG